MARFGEIELVANAVSQRVGSREQTLHHASAARELGGNHTFLTLIRPEVLTPVDSILVVPAINSQLAGDDQGAGIVAILDDLQQITLLLGHRLGSPQNLLQLTSCSSILWA